MIDRTQPDAVDVTAMRQLAPEALAAALNEGQKPDTLGARMGFRLTSATPERIEGTMPVAGNLQPAGRLHGGANAAFIEELASIGSWLNLDPATQMAVGVDLNATHLRGATSGLVTGVAILTHRGRSLHVWQVELRDERGKPTCTGRLTCAVLSR